MNVLMAGNKYLLNRMYNFYLVPADKYNCHIYDGYSALSLKSSNHGASVVHGNFPSNYLRYEEDNPIPTEHA